MKPVSIYCPTCGGDVTLGSTRTGAGTVVVVLHCSDRSHKSDLVIVGRRAEYDSRPTQVHTLAVT